MSYGTQAKKVVFEDTDYRYAQLRVRLRHDGLTQVQFFQSMISGYLNRDPDMMKYVTTVCDSFSKHGRKRIAENVKAIDTGRKIAKNFSLTKAEKENLFDLIADEVGEL